MRTNKATFPPRVTFAPSIPDRTYAIEGRKILPLVLFKVCSQVMLESALVGELAFLRREFGVENSGRAKALCIRRSPEATVSVLTGSFLFLIFIVNVAIIVMRGFGVVVRARFGDLGGMGTSSGCLNDEPSVKSQVNLSC